MSRFWSSVVHALDPYVPGEQPDGEGVIKLNTNENPYPPSPAVCAVLKSFPVDQLRRYPQPESDDLAAVIAGYHGVPRDRLFLGNGSDEVLAHAFNAFFRKDSPVLFPDITYGFYPVYCQLFGIESVQLPVNGQFEIDLSAYVENEATRNSGDEANGGIIFPNPNAPTGLLKSLDAIEQLLEKNQNSVVIVDEAYIDFATERDVASVSAIKLTDQYPNLLVVRTLSKSRALAGIRLGYAIGDEVLIDGLRRIKNSFNSYPLDSLATELAKASFADEAYFEQSRHKVIAGRQYLEQALTQLGFQCLPSGANFLLVKHQNQQSPELFRQLRERDIIVRYFSKARIDQYLRITVGTESDNQALIAALKNIIR